jgi:hypothetical protein
VEKVHMTANTALLVIRPPLVSDLWPRSLMTGKPEVIGSSVGLVPRNAVLFTKLP